MQTALGLSDAEFASAPYCSTVINTNSPRMLDRPMAQALIDFGRAGQMCIVTPFCLAGAMAPITVAGALTLQHAEALAAITLNQLTAPGAPVMYGGFGSNVDMKSGAPAFGTPEHIQMSIGSGNWPAISACLGALRLARRPIPMTCRPPMKQSCLFGAVCRPMPPW